MTPIGEREYRDRLERVLASGGGQAFPRAGRDRAILLHALSQRLASAPRLDEREVTGLITAWLATTGAALEVDAVSLRRYLVDDGFLERDPSGSSYRPSSRFEDRTPFAAEVKALDPEDLIERARERRRERRATRGVPPGEL